MTIKVGIIGCGDIARKAYVTGLRQFDILDLVACADIDEAASQRLSQDFNIPNALSVQDLLYDKCIDLVVNLTTPQAHTAVNHAVLDAGKHVYVEKPFALSRQEAQSVLTKASANGLLVGGAPDTFLGAGLQTGIKAVEDGLIGKPIAASAFVAYPGPESWHPNPDFLYQKGAGPLLDMGPYYLTALVTLLGPIKSVSGMAGAAFPERIITNEEQYGKKIPVEVNTHVSALIEFHCGVIATLIISWDVKKHQLPRLEIYGSEGSLSMPDPNEFGGPVRIFRSQYPDADWPTIPLISSYQGECRGIGVAELAYAAAESRSPRASGRLASHVLDAMLAIDEAAALKGEVQLKSTVGKPALLPVGF